MAAALFIFAIVSFFNAIISFFKWLPWKLCKTEATFLINDYNEEANEKGKEPICCYAATAICNNERTDIVIRSAKQNGESPYSIGGTCAGKCKGQQFKTEHEIKNLYKTAFVSLLTSVACAAAGVLLIVISDNI